MTSPVPPINETGVAPPPPGWLRQRIIEGSLWLVALRWALRGLSLVRTVILARLLAPADFGLFGMAMLVIRAIEVPTSLDVDVALVRRADTDRALFDSAWTLRAVHRLAVMACLLIGAPLAGWYFNDARVIPAVRIAALSGLLWAFENIGIVTFRKELAFAKEFALSATTTLATLAVTIAGALLLHNYWALIAGFVVERVVWMAGTYAAHPYRPRPNWTAVRELWEFSQWIPVQNTGRLLRNSVDSFLVGRFFDAASWGIYSMAGSAAGLAVAEIVGPVSSALLPSYAKLAKEPERLSRGFVDSLAMLAMLVIASQVGVAAIAPTFFPVVLGPRWIPAVATAQWLALYTCINTLTGSVANVLIVQGRMRRLSGIIYLQLVVYVPILLLAVQSRDLVMMATAKLVAAILVAPSLFLALIAVSSVTMRQIATVLWRPVIASGFMAMIVEVVASRWVNPSLASLAAQVVGGIAAFTVAVTLLWIAAGRPAGAERTVRDWLRRRIPPQP